MGKRCSLQGLDEEEQVSAIHKIRRWGGVVGVVLLIAATGCASAGMGAGGERTVAVEVENNLIPPTSLSVFAVPETGTRRLIGVVEPSTTETLRFDPVAAGGQYVFVAESTAGAEIVSDPVTITEPMVMNWDLAANIITVTGE